MVGVSESKGDTEDRVTWKQMIQYDDPKREKLKEGEDDDDDEPNFSHLNLPQSV